MQVLKKRSRFWAEVVVAPPKGDRGRGFSAREVDGGVAAGGQGGLESYFVATLID